MNNPLSFLVSRRSLPQHAFLALVTAALLGCASPPASTAQADGSAPDSPSSTAQQASRDTPAPKDRTPDAVLQGFQPSGKYILVVDGEELPKAKIYEAGLPAILVRSTSLPTPAVLIPRARQVQQVPITALGVNADGSVDIAADAELIPSGGFTVEGQDVVFNVGGHQVRIQPRPWLLGEQGGARMADYNPEYALGKERYQPAAPAVDSLRTEGNARVQVFFGSWCPACKSYVPRLLRVETELGGQGPEFLYYGLPSPFKDEPEATRLDVVSVPTAVVFVDGKEVGRINSADQWNQPEIALRDILAGS